MEKDTTIRKILLGLIGSDKTLKAKDITVDVNRGVVTLSGRVQNIREKRLAERLAKRLREVKVVAMDLKVDRREPNKDAQIAAEIADAFACDPRLADGNITVAVDNGWVTLEGEVNDPCRKVAAFNAVNDINHVKGISNRIIVRAGMYY